MVNPSSNPVNDGSSDQIPLNLPGETAADQNNKRLSGATAVVRDVNSGPATVSTFQAIRKVPGRAWLAWLSCDFGGVLLGYDCFYINGLLGMDQFKLDFGKASTAEGNVLGYMYSNLEKAIVVSIFALGVARKSFVMLIS